jgi:hypothetical protein
MAEVGSVRREGNGGCVNKGKGGGGPAERRCLRGVRLVIRSVFYSVGYGQVIYVVRNTIRERVFIRGWKGWERNIEGWLVRGAVRQRRKWCSVWYRVMGGKERGGLHMREIVGRGQGWSWGTEQMFVVVLSGRGRDLRVRVGPKFVVVVVVTERF